MACSVDCMASNPDVRPFHIDIPQAELDDLHRRLDQTRWPDPIPGTESEWSHGIAPDYLRKLADYWAEGFDWRTCEAELNKFDQFTTEIDGQRIHFLHLRSAEPDATPLLLVPAYPSSFVEFLEMIAPLIDPRAHGADPKDAFHVVIPSLPGFVFSSPTSSTGWGPERTAKAFGELMSRLGYERFGTQAGDIAAGVTGQMGALFPDRVIGNLLNTDRIVLGMAGEQYPVPEGLTEEDLNEIEAARQSWSQQRGYQILITTQPNALAMGLTDSPILQLAWIAEKYRLWIGERSQISQDKILTVASLYWFTRTGGSSTDFYWELSHSSGWSTAANKVAQGTAAFNSTPLLRKVADPGGGAFFRSHTEGGHFPAFEVPDLLVEDLRTFFRSVRD